LRARHCSQTKPNPNITAPAISPNPEAAKAVVPKVAMGIAFWMDGVPGKAVIVNVKAPKAMAAGINRCGRPVYTKSAWASGQAAKATTKSDTPP